MPVASSVVRALSVTALVLLAACAGSTARPATSQAPTPSPTPAALSPSPQPSPSLLPGGEVPVELKGAWYLYSRIDQLTLTGHVYDFQQPDATAGGNVVVNGDEIDFFNGNLCGIPLPGGVGKYRWTVKESHLTFSALNTDPCARSAYLLDSHGWTRTNRPP